MRCLALVLCFGFGVGSLSRAQPGFPPVTGELSGDFAILAAPDAPKIHWKVSAAPTENGEREISFSAGAPGARLRASGRVDARGNGVWRIDECEVDLGPWFPAFASFLPPAMSGVSFSGKLGATGQGVWRDGKLGGKCAISLRDGRLDDPTLKLLLEGISLDLAIDDLAKMESPRSQILTWQAGHYDVVALGAGRAEFSVAAEAAHVEHAVLHAFAGELVVGEFTVGWAKPEFAVTAEVHGLDIAMLVPLLPPVVSEAHGRLDGTLSLKRNATGIEIGAGRLGLRPGDSAQLRLTPTPGLLSSSLPATVKKYYPGLGDLEQGRVPLKADLLEVTFTPGGDAEGRTAFVRVAGGPVDPRMRAPVDLTVNVRGPLEWLVKFGTDSRLHFR